MTLSVLETSLPMQRSHDTLASGISAKNWCLGASVTAQAVTSTLYHSQHKNSVFTKLNSQQQKNKQSNVTHIYHPHEILTISMNSDNSDSIFTMIICDNLFLVFQVSGKTILSL